MLEVRDLHSFYGDAHVIHGVSLDVAPGEVVALLGRNGMGKTTLIRSIMGLSPPQVRDGQRQAGEGRGTASACGRTTSQRARSLSCRRAAGCSRR